MYNFTIPSQLKAWIDRIMVAGKTFKYGAQGAEGLAGGKRVIVAISRGGFYGADTPAAVGEHLETYLRWVFGFIGITQSGIHFSRRRPGRPRAPRKGAVGRAAGGRRNCRRPDADIVHRSAVLTAAGGH